VPALAVVEAVFAARVLLESADVALYGDSRIHAWQLKVMSDPVSGKPTFADGVLLHASWHAHATTAFFLARLLDPHAIEYARRFPDAASSLFAVQGVQRSALAPSFLVATSPRAFAAAVRPVSQVEVAITSGSLAHLRELLLGPLQPGLARSADLVAL